MIYGIEENSRIRELEALQLLRMIISDDALAIASLVCSVLDFRDMEKTFGRWKVSMLLPLRW